LLERIYLLGVLDGEQASIRSFATAFEKMKDKINDSEVITPY
jgi:hypothetical protein